MSESLVKYLHFLLCCQGSRRGNNSNSIGKWEKTKLLLPEVKTLLNKCHKQLTWTFTCRTKVQPGALSIPRKSPCAIPAGQFSMARTDFLQNMLQASLYPFAQTSQSTWNCFPHLPRLANSCSSSKMHSSFSLPGPLWSQHQITCFSLVHP